MVMSQNKSKKRTKVSKRIFLAKNPKNEIAENTFFDNGGQDAHAKKDSDQDPPVIFAISYDTYLRVYFLGFNT